MIASFTKSRAYPTSAHHAADVAFTISEAERVAGISQRHNPHKVLAALANLLVFERISAQVLQSKLSDTAA
jgi:hypothetical protein